MGKMSELDIARQDLEGLGYTVMKADSKDWDRWLANEMLADEMLANEQLNEALLKAMKLLEQSLAYARDPYIDGENEFDEWQREVRTFLQWQVIET